MITKYCTWILVFCGFFATASTMAKDVSNLTGRMATWEKAFNASNLKAVAALYAADGCRMPPNTPTVQGTNAILTHFQHLKNLSKDLGISKIKVVVTTAETCNTSGYGIGTYELLKADGSRVDYGKWMSISKKVKGKWVIQCDMFNSNMPPAPLSER